MNTNISKTIKSLESLLSSVDAQTFNETPGTLGSILSNVYAQTLGSILSNVYTRTLGSILNNVYAQTIDIRLGTSGVWGEGNM